MCLKRIPEGWGVPPALDAVKRKLIRAVLLCGVLPAALAGAYLWYFGGPYRFVEVPLRPAFVEYAARQKGAPLEAADEYLHGNCHPSDRPKLAELDSEVEQASVAEAVVTIINRRCGDDCVSAQCDRVTLRRQAGGWVPVKHEVTWQSRSNFGWSTKTPS